ncbi:hypothetical protein SAMN05421736_11857 [Evansella caseinilytica]|uniref:Uncharacterized protein n=1 Tax=Evansella caseinilytica TaxID=1503961 RepID=A0A1H3U4P4_9BACI|nr:hypothetical protein [Evansella caseinilytica]SDZ57308.1 hypothetical protein SAMN05421736_11857 [Evansella caseinilytica]
MLHADEAKNEENREKAGKCFKDIQDLCWKMRGVLGEFGQKDVWKEFRNIENRKKLAKLIADIKSLDEKALEYLRLAVRDKEIIELPESVFPLLRPPEEPSS